MPTASPTKPTKACKKQKCSKGFVWSKVECACVVRKIISIILINIDRYFLFTG
jgi:hypothetical protein